MSAYSDKGFDALCRFINGKSIAIAGLGVSNMPLVELFLKNGAKSVSVRDLKKTVDSPEVITAVGFGGKAICGENYLENLNEDIIIRSPVIRPDKPEFINAVKKGAVLTSETELYLRFTPGKTIAVTGSDGKTTTVTLIYEILKNAGVKAFCGGNIGKPLIPFLMEADNLKTDFVTVIELSSFQLMNTKYSPDVAVITNISENHLDWHKDMEEYISAKESILSHQKPDFIAVLNYDNKYTDKFKTNGKRLYFSFEKEVENGVFIKNGKICFSENSKVREIISCSDIILPGKHNKANYMAAIAATAQYAKPENIKAVASSFKGVEHRIELVENINGVLYYNSSIDSTPARTAATINSFDKKLIVICGGYDKNLSYDFLGELFNKRVKTVILCGKTSGKIMAAVQKSGKPGEGCKLIKANSFEETVRLAHSVAKKGDIVILSPASASFDLFKNFEERGRVFKSLVYDLKQKEEAHA